jgi:voltage-gated potassium channel
MTTVGYGDMAPTTDYGRFLAVLMMISGIILIAIITATISSKVITKKIMEGKGLKKINIIDHVLICGWSSNIINLIKELLDNKNSKNIQLVLVNDQSQNEIDNITSSFPSIKFVRGDYSIDSILEKANTSKAKYALLLNDNHSHGDDKVILSTLTIKKLSNNIKVIAQINDKNKIPFLKRANADIVLSTDDYTSFMAIANILEPVSAQAINAFIDISSNNSIISKVIPDEFIGKSFGEFHHYMYSDKANICLGLYNNEENVGISDILSSDNSVLDRFIEKKLKEAGHSLSEQNKLNVMLNPSKNTIIQKGQGALILK